MNQISCGIDNMHNNTPRPFIWTPDNVTAFWSMLTETPLARLSFSRMVHDDLVRFVSAFAPSGARILDFGGGDGDLAEGLLQAGFQVGIYEPAEGRKDRALKKMTEHANWLGFFDPSSREQFDIVCAFEVLEHFLEGTFREDMALLATFLAPDGKIIGTVPLEEDLELASCLCPECGSFFHRMQHQRSFNRESLTASLCKAGLVHCHAFTVNFAACLGFAAGFSDFSLPDIYIAAPQTLHEALVAARQSEAALQRQVTAYEKEREKYEAEHEKLMCDLGGEHNVGTLQNHGFAVRVLGKILRRWERICHRIPLFSRRV